MLLMTPCAPPVIGHDVEMSCIPVWECQSLSLSLSHPPLLQSPHTPPPSPPLPLRASRLPSFPRESSSFWIWFSRKSIATPKVSTANSCNLGGIIILSSPINLIYGDITRASGSVRTGHATHTRPPGSFRGAGDEEEEGTAMCCGSSVITSQCTLTLRRFSSSSRSSSANPLRAMSPFHALYA